MRGGVVSVPEVGGALERHVWARRSRRSLRGDMSQPSRRDGRRAAQQPFARALTTRPVDVEAMREAVRFSSAQAASLETNTCLFLFCRSAALAHYVRDWRARAIALSHTIAVARARHSPPVERKTDVDVVTQGHRRNLSLTVYGLQHEAKAALVSRQITSLAHFVPGRSSPVELLTHANSILSTERWNKIRRNSEDVGEHASKGCC
ncbi:hypothetical protein FGB62_403g00 [Gracilaria domingensis]|nr:hypothetical protein FGB62_403g00 [Gracilaria domingensis]